MYIIILVSSLLLSTSCMVMYFKCAEIRLSTSILGSNAQNERICSLFYFDMKMLFAMHITHRITSFHVVDGLECVKTML